MLTTHRLGRLAGAGALSTLLLLAACEQSSDSPTGLQPPGIAENAALEGQVEAATIHVCQSLTQGGPETGEYELDVDGNVTTFQVTGDAPFLFDGTWNYVDVDGAGCTEVAAPTGASAHVTVTNAISLAATGNRLATTGGTWTFHTFTSSPSFDPDGGAVLWFKPLLEEPEGGLEGCTPGYWKNHTDSWPPTGYSPAQSVSSVFAAAGAYTQGSASLLDALSFGGGPGVEGGVKILLRAAVAGLLNASHPGVDYTTSAAALIADVDAALASGDRDTMLALASSIDADNNLGCPLN